MLIGIVYFLAGAVAIAPEARDSVWTWLKNLMAEKPDPLLVDLARNISNEERLHNQFHDLEKAEASARGLLQLRQKSVGETHPLTLNILEELVDILVRRAKYDEAESCMLSLFERRRVTEGGSKINDIGKLANIYLHMGNLQAAEVLYRDFIAMEAMNHISFSPEIISHQGTLTSIIMQQERYGEAVTLLEMTTEHMRSVFGAAHDVTLWNLSLLADLYRSHGDLPLMADRLLEGYQDCREELGPTHAKTVKFHADAMEVAMEIDPLPDDKLFTTLLNSITVSNDIEHQFALLSLNRLGLQLCKKGLYDKAEHLYRRLYTLFLFQYDANEPLIASLRGNIAWCLRERGMSEEALQLLEKGFAEVPPPEWYFPPEAVFQLSLAALLRAETGRGVDEGIDHAIEAILAAHPLRSEQWLFETISPSFFRFVVWCECNTDLDAAKTYEALMQTATRVEPMVSAVPLPGL